MPQQLIYTSAPRGIVAGRSGHCTVARSALMREPVMLQLEKFSYYQHLSLSGGLERPIFVCRIMDIRGTRFHVLSRIQDSGLDFTGRTNFIAHHLVFTPEEIRQFPTPPVILREWPGWVKLWTKEPQLLENENWADLTALAGKSNIPAQTWQRVTTDAVNGYGLLEARAGASFRVDNQTDETVLELIAESLELLEVRDTRRDFRTAAWNYTFTTSMQEQDNPADFRWRCIHSDNPAANRFATPDCRELSAVRANRWTDKEKENEETAFARIGRQPPRFVEQPKYQQIKEGETAAFASKAAGIPTPNYQWYECDQNGKEKNKLDGQTSAKLVLENCKRGTTRYLVWATNGVGDDCRSDPVKLDVEPPKQPLTISKQDGKSSAVGRTTAQKPQVAVWEDSEPISSDSIVTISGWWLIVIIIAALVIGGGVWWKIKHRPPKSEPGSNTASASAGSGMPTSVPSPTPAAPTNQPTSTQLADSKAASGKPKPQTERVVNSPPPTEFGLPDGWTPMNVGAVLNVNAEYINVKPPPRFDLSAAATGFLTNGDSILFVCKTNTGNEFKATLLKIDSRAVQNRCGIMIRESQKSDSPFLFVGASLQKIFAYRRDAKGELFSDEIDIPKADEGRPVILKFYPKDKLFALAYSFDAKDWPSFPDYVISNSTQTLVGFAISSGSSSVPVTAHFVDVSPKK
jgi:hypothetical protein